MANLSSFRRLNEGQKVSFEVVAGRDGKSSADNLALAGS
ncbi:MAG: cold shock domain-containing protein [Rhodospirillaceae bacterium]|nr:cold shock domain-containing protein [Rhodospirillaceae bacterium]